jgi:Fic family protein
VREYLTFKSGKFYFNEKYELSEIGDLLVRATVLNETIVDLPILPKLASSIQPNLMYSSIAGTAAIEGNPITGEDVERIARGEDPEIYTKKDKQEIKNLINAYNFLGKVEPSPTKPLELTEEKICALHKIITLDVPDPKNVPGQYRNGVVHVGDSAHGGVYTPPKNGSDIKKLMEVFTEWINSDEVLHSNPFIRAALAHYYFCIIHPFWDGNGRTARLIEAMILQTANIKYAPRELSNYYYRNVDEYYNAFSRSIKLKKNAAPFLKFSLEASVESLARIKETIIYFIRKFTLQDFYKFQNKQKIITTRQRDLLELLLDKPMSFTLRELQEVKPLSLLYNRVTTQTARRDLKKLVSEKLLLLGEDNKYFLNLRALD